MTRPTRRSQPRRSTVLPALLLAPILIGSAALSAAPGPARADSAGRAAATPTAKAAATPAAKVAAQAAAKFYVLTSGKVDNTSESVIYTGPWVASAAVQDDSGSVERTIDPASAKMTFYGTGVSMSARTNNYSGIVKVTIDGKPAGTADLYSPTLKYQQVVFRSKTMDEGTHTIVIERSGQLNKHSTGRGINLDDFKVTDQTPPPTPPAPDAAADVRGVVVSWTASPASDIDRYHLLRTDGTDGPGAEVDLGQVPAQQLSFRDVDADRGTSYSYRVSAVDNSGNESKMSPASATATVPDLPVTTRRYANCPDATKNVASSAALTAALATAVPGDVIVLAPGTYKGVFSLTASGTDTAPIWVCGPRTAVIDRGDYTRSTTLLLDHVSHVVITGFSIRNGQKGILVSGGNDVTLSDLAVDSVGDEAFHLRAFTTDSFVVGNTVTDTGLYQPQFGEGVYVGSDPDAWCSYSNCLPDNSDRNVIADNVFTGTTAEGIDAKGGTTGGVIAGNRVDGSKMVVGAADALVVVKGNSWLIDSNVGYHALANGFAATYTKRSGWGGDNVFVRNTGDVGNATGYLVWMQQSIGNLAGCSNDSDSGVRDTNLACQG